MSFNASRTDFGVACFLKKDKFKKSEGVKQNERSNTMFMYTPQRACFSI